MNKVMFPKRDPDGMFCVEIVMAPNGRLPQNLGEEVQKWWINCWLPDNRTWLRTWSTAGKEVTEALIYDEEFSAAPQVSLCSDSEFRFRLLGKNTAKWWRDWMVSRIIPDLQAQFSGIGGFVTIRDCE